MKVSISYYKNVEVKTKGPICPLCQIGLVLDKHVGDTSEFKCPMCINEVKKIVITYRYPFNQRSRK